MDLYKLISSKYDISKDKVEKAKVLIEELSKIPREAILVGGTAINLAYFGKFQRISYDIDLEVKDREKFRKEFSKKYNEAALTKKMDVFEKNGIKIDLMDYLGGKVVERNIESLFTLSGIPMYVKVRTLEFEELLARKLIALSRRGTAKDLYDCYVGVIMEHDREKVRNAIKRIDKEFYIPSKKYVDLNLERIDSLILDVEGEDAFAFVRAYLEGFGYF